MLFLDRLIGESVSVGGIVRVQVVAVDGDTVRLGFDAPREVPIVRDDAVVATRYAFRQELDKRVKKEWK